MRVGYGISTSGPYANVHRGGRSRGGSIEAAAIGALAKGTTVGAIVLGPLALALFAAYLGGLIIAAIVIMTLMFLGPVIALGGFVLAAATSGPRSERQIAFAVAVGTAAGSAFCWWAAANGIGT